MRIVSLLASATEIVCALGAGERLVGRSHECDNPAWVKGLPECSVPAFDIQVSSGQIDAEVRRRLRTGEPLYVVNDALIESLKPDVIFAQSHCRVCAVTPDDVGRATVALSAGTMAEIFESIRQVAAALELPADAVIGREQARLHAVRAMASKNAVVRVAMLEWANPLFQMSNWMPELVEIAGGSLVSIDEDPDCVIVAPCGFDLGRSLCERPVLERNPWWRELRAVKAGRVAYADGNLFFNRSGMTVTATAELIARLLHEPASDGEFWRWM